MNNKILYDKIIKSYFIIWFIESDVYRKRLRDPTIAKQSKNAN